MSTSHSHLDPFAGIMGAKRGRSAHDNACPAQPRSTTEERMRRFADDVLLFGAGCRAVRSLSLTYRLRVNRRTTDPSLRGYHGPTLLLEDRENPNAPSALLLTEIVHGLDGKDPADVDLIERVRLDRLQYEARR